MLINMGSIDSKTVCQLLDIFEPLTSVGLVLPWSTTSSASTVPDVHEFVHSFVILLKDISVIELLFSMWSVDWIFLLSGKELFICDHRVASILEFCNPSHTDSLALHGLCAPKYLIRHFTLESLSENMFFSGSVITYEFVSWVNLHDLIDHIWVKEGNTCLKTMGHRHSVRSLTVYIVQMPENSPELFLEILFVGRVTEVQISTK